MAVSMPRAPTTADAGGGEASGRARRPIPGRTSVPGETGNDSGREREVHHEEIIELPGPARGTGSEWNRRHREHDHQGGDGGGRAKDRRCQTGNDREEPDDGRDPPSGLAGNEREREQGPGPGVEEPPLAPQHPPGSDSDAQAPARLGEDVGGGRLAGDGVALEGDGPPLSRDPRGNEEV